ncbi:hypothetical protein [Actinomarinicola tropica]|uniref:DUF5709 domain-containing protein n=1 Tax=Actinomarinicola tropica TaxID=2789776 RepID=A0A5Q2RME8_9ACTN|nr:hypothetical protein [Actinomarinicola tropica]QGG95731.1 hypothetical protein GH723_11830 [Actinomarinicola tropica]
MAPERHTSDPVENEEEVLREFPRGEPTSLAEQRDLTDETGADIREYTGEPVDTGDGVVIPQQQNVGEERSVGEGEFHDGDDESDPGGDAQA